ncbi:MAG: cephalosporin hydroxylase family protein [Thiotrichaceae bacterium]|nr:cephalosporin hydroxylase family protein [Thiotrichaceae bacterium]
MKKNLTFEEDKKKNLQKVMIDKEVMLSSYRWICQTAPYKYSYNFKWLGRPIIQYPQDIMAMQELIWEIQPDLIIETGIAHGGSLIFYASMLELLGNGGQVLGIDIDIRSHNRIEIEKHPMYKHITMLEGSSIDEKIIKQVYAFAKDKQRIMVTLDSNHTHEHVLKELQAYAPLVTKDSYLVVFDTIVEDMPEDFFPDRPWEKGNNPKTAVWEFLKNNDRFEIDKTIETKLLITVAPDGYLKCIKD